MLIASFWRWIDPLNFLPFNLGNQSSTTASKDSFKTAEKKVELAGLKRKKKFNRDDGATEPKIAKKPKSKKLSFTGDNDYSTGSKISKSESWKAQSGGVGDKGNENSSFSKKATKIRMKRPGVISERDFSGKMRNKKFQKKGYLQTGIKKLNRKISTDGSRKESYDKKLEARRKRRAKGKVIYGYVNKKEVNNLNSCQYPYLKLPL